jgi:hypothetical protein
MDNETKQAILGAIVLVYVVFGLVLSFIQFGTVAGVLLTFGFIMVFIECGTVMDKGD